MLALTAGAAAAVAAGLAAVAASVPVAPLMGTGGGRRGTVLTAASSMRVIWRNTGSDAASTPANGSTTTCARPVASPKVAEAASLLTGPAADADADALAAPGAEVSALVATGVETGSGLEQAATNVTADAVSTKCKWVQAPIHEVVLFTGHIFHFRFAACGSLQPLVLASRDVSPRPADRDDVSLSSLPRLHSARPRVLTAYFTQQRLLGACDDCARR